MTTLNLDRLKEYRNHIRRFSPNRRIKNVDEAESYVNECGFITFWPAKGLDLPSLWGAVAGDRPVPSEHDDPGNITWEWKDANLGSRRWYYGRTIHHRNALISFAYLPYFYALSPNYGDPETDYLDQYALGQLIPEAKNIYEALLRNGPMDTLSLRRAAHLSNPTSDSRFNRGLDELQMQFKVIPIGISPVGAWRYAFIYDIAPRHYPEIVELARPISENEARTTLSRRFLELMGALRKQDIARAFGWRPPDAEAVQKRLLDEGVMICVQHPTDKHEWISLPEVL